MAVTLNASTSTGYIQTADTSGDLALQSNGTTQFTVSSTGAYGQLKSGTAVASTSGTSIDFTSIPSWVKRITVMFSGVSTSGTSAVLVQLGTSGGVVTSGYLGSANSANFTTGFSDGLANASAVRHGTYIITSFGSNTWCSSVVIGASGITPTNTPGGFSVTLSGTLDRVRITTVNGTDTFDAGSINILYEG